MQLSAGAVNSEGALKLPRPVPGEKLGERSVVAVCREDKSVDVVAEVISVGVMSGCILFGSSHMLKLPHTARDPVT